MWFKQITCDTCFAVMPEITRHNKYYFADLLYSKSVHGIGDRNVTISNNSLELTVKGKNGFSQIRTSTFSPKNWMTFCCSKCASEFSKINNIVLCFFSEDNQSVSLIHPCLEDFNNVPIPIPEWSEFDWFCQFYDIIDLTSFGTSSTFPEFTIEDVRLTYPSLTTTMALINMINTKEFRTMFYGSYDKQFAEKQKREMLRNVRNLVNEFNTNYGRRAQIDWHIINANNDFLGFIHLTKLYQAIPDEWVLEFGLRPEYEHRGIMTRAIKIVLDWIKSQGCEDVYAISEIFNEKSHSLFGRLNVPVKTSRASMWDEHAGERLMYNYHIKLL